MARDKDRAAGLTHLGSSKNAWPAGYSPKLLEAFDNAHPGRDCWVGLNCPEFTSLCPKTGQPDFARILINYVPDKKMVESKSLKLYLGSFRNHGAFHEDCIQTICQDLAHLLRPRYLEVMGEFSPRGGISIWPFASCACDESRWQRLKEERASRHFPHFHQ